MPPLHQLVFMTMWLASCSYAGFRGGAPERLAAAAQFCAGVFTLLCGLLGHAITDLAVSIGVALTDFSLFVALTLIAIFSTRFWPILMASMTGCGLFGHFGRLIGPDILPDAYYATVAFWGYPTVILLVVATSRHRIRLKRYGVDYAWVWNLPRRYHEGWSVNELSAPLPQR